MNQFFFVPLSGFSCSVCRAPCVSRVSLAPCVSRTYIYCRVIYGLCVGDFFPTVITNLFGFFLSVYYCAVYAWAVEPPARKAATYNMFAATFLAVWYAKHTNMHQTCDACCMILQQ